MLEQILRENVLQSLPTTNTRKAAMHAQHIHIRDAFPNLFGGPGRIPWQ